MAEDISGVCVVFMCLLIIISLFLVAETIEDEFDETQEKLDELIELQKEDNKNKTTNQTLTRGLLVSLSTPAHEQVTPRLNGGGL